MTCELWVRGVAESAGPFNLDAPWRTPWDENRPFPPISLHLAGNPYSFYTDGFGGTFNGTGWYSVPEYYLKGCTPKPLDPNQPYDCINGNCLPKATYNTPGKYANVAACQSGCAKDSNCTGECVDPAEIAALNQAISTLRSRICS